MSSYLPKYLIIPKSTSGGRSNKKPVFSAVFILFYSGQYTITRHSKVLSACYSCSEIEKMKISFDFSHAMRSTAALVSLAIIAAVFINQVCGQSCASNRGEATSVVQYQLGDTICNITLYERAGDMSFVSFINLHANENTSVVAARSLIYLNGGRLVYLRHGNNSRLITFSLEGSEYTFDPNRMFTPVGIEKTLKDNGNYSDSASKAVQAFAAKVLEVYQFDKQYTVVSIHNNGPLYSAEAYLPNATFAQDAAEGNYIPRQLFIICLS